MIGRLHNKLPYVILIFAILVGFIIRFFQLGSLPSGVLVDEASFGYNAYSILNTGKDEHGISFPMVFRAFGDQKLPAYAYLTVLFVKMFGLNNFAIRSVSAVSGVLFILCIYYLITSLGYKKQTAAFASLVAAIAPWSIILSRFGYESNLALLLFTVGLTCLFKAIRSKLSIFFILSVLCFGFTWYSYVAFRMITLLFLFSSFAYLLLKKHLRIKQITLSIMTFLIILLPILPQSLSKSGSARFSQIGIFSDQGPMLVIQEMRNYCTTHLPTIICYSIWNKPTVYGALIIERFIATISPSYLFLKGDEFLTYLNVDGFGQFPVVLLPFYMIGIFALFLQKKKGKEYIPVLIAIGVISSVIPSILAGEPQKIRLSGLLPFVIILIAIGYEWFSQYVKKSYIFVFSCILFFALIISTVCFMVSFLTVHIDKYDMAFNTPVTKLMDYLAKQDKRIRIKIYPSFSDPIMQYAYNKKIDPKIYQSSIVWDELEPSGFMHAKQLENIEVTHDEYHSEELCTLYVTDRKLAVSPLALKYSVTSTNGVHTLLYVYSADTLHWCP